MTPLKRPFALALAVTLAGLAAAPRAIGQHDDPYATNSVLYRAAASGKANAFVAAQYAAGLTDTLRGGGPFTAFVPTDEAFAKLPPGTLEKLLRPENREALAALLKYHVVPGRILAKDITSEPQPKTVAGPPLTIAANDRGIAVNEATVVQADLAARNGVVHLIDRVLMPPADDVLAVARQAGRFSTLLKAIDVAGLEEALRDEGPVTVFAPTDEAFAKLPPATLQALLKDKEALRAVLTYHVVDGKQSARDLARADEVETLNGGDVRPGIDDGRLTVNNARVLKSDIAAGNGVIHVIDAVLVPPKH